MRCSVGGQWEARGREVPNEVIPSRKCGLAQGAGAALPGWMRELEAWVAVGHFSDDNPDRRHYASFTSSKEQLPACLES